MLGEPAATAVTSPYAGPPVAIPDASEAGVSTTLPVSGVGPVTSPDGTTVRLFDHGGDGGNNFCRTELTDAADRPIESALDVDEPFTGSWRPVEPLSGFGGHAGAGDWRFAAPPP